MIRQNYHSILRKLIGCLLLLGIISQPQNIPAASAAANQPQNGGVTQAESPSNRSSAYLSHLTKAGTNLYELYEQDEILIKFSSERRIRLRNQLPQDMNSEISAAGLDGLSSLSMLSAGGEWHQAYSVGEDKLDTLRMEGERRSGLQLPDMNNYFRLQLPAGMDAVEAVAQFGAHEWVEKASLIAKPVVEPFAIDFSKPGNLTGDKIDDPYQGYLGPALDGGIDAQYAWQGPGGDGAGIKICDVEKNYNAHHTDLNQVTFVGGTPDPDYPDDHGTAVMGIYGGRDDNLGIKGIAYAAELYFASTVTLENGFDMTAAILACVSVLEAGDILLIEAQTVGPNTEPSPILSSHGLVPVEWREENYDAIVTAVANGIVVIEAAGNGRQNLDHIDYQTGNNGHYPFLPENDSGAILIGAGLSPIHGDEQRSASWFTNYGATVDIQGWGDGIVTTGYGNLYPGGEPNAEQKNKWYTELFNGTSSAAAIVAGAAAIVQSTYKLEHGVPATPAQIKEILQSTGTPEVGDKRVGPLPNLRSAINMILGESTMAVSPPIVGKAGGIYDSPIHVSLYHAPGQDAQNTRIHYTLDGWEPTGEDAIFVPGVSEPLYIEAGTILKAKAFQYDVSTDRTYESETVITEFIIDISSPDVVGSNTVLYSFYMPIVNN